MKTKNGILILQLLIIGIVLMLSNGCNKDNNPVNPTGSHVYTTLDRIVVPVPVPTLPVSVFPDEIAKYSQNGYGVWQYGPGLGFQKRLDIMPASYSYASVTNTAKLLHFFAMTDIHLSDKESPASMIYMSLSGIGSPSGYSPTMLYTTHVLDAAVRTVNALHKQNPFDYGISLGDDCNNAQYNELRWFIDIFDGKSINPDSGPKDDPIPGPGNDYQDEYQAAGLDNTIPWYQVYGNHDNLWMGSYTENDYLQQAHTGVDILNMGDVFTDPLGADSRGFYMGVIDGQTQYGDVIGAGLVGSMTPPQVMADPNRR